MIAGGGGGLFSNAPVTFTEGSTKIMVKFAMCNGPGRSHTANFPMIFDFDTPEWSCSKTVTFRECDFN